MQRLDFVDRIVLSRYSSKNGSDEGSQLRKLLNVKAEVMQLKTLLETLQADLGVVTYDLRMHWEQQQPAFRLHTLLENCERSLCQEPRDKVYRLLGLASNVDDGEVAVDYSKSLFELYVDILTHYRTSQGSETSGNADLTRFSQLLQRSLSGPFPYNSSAENTTLNISTSSAAGPAIRIEAYVSGPILPLEPTRKIETPTDTIEQERIAILKTYFKGSVDISVLSGEISKTLSQLRPVDRDRVVPNPSSRRFRSPHATAFYRRLATSEPSTSF